jgi:hypothetical protein
LKFDRSWGLIVEMKRVMGITISIVFVACTDKAAPDYAKCMQADSAGYLQNAYDACKRAVADDPTSTSGRKAAALIASKRYVDWKQSEEDRSAENDRAHAAAAASQAAAQSAAEAKCQTWATNCKVGYFPDGSEQWTGVQSFHSKASCDGAGPTLGLLKCLPCKCMD